MSDIIFPSEPVFLIDDEENFLMSAEFTLNSNGITNTITCADSRQVMDILREKRVCCILLDMTMPYLKGWELLPQIIADHPAVPVIIATAINEVEMAVDCMKNGAFDYLIKPVDDTRIITTVKRAIELRAMRDENRRLKQYLLSGELENPEAFSDIVTDDPRMRTIFQYIEAVAGSPLPILVTGETGSGKELIARAIHNLSQRKGQFVPVNVAGVDDQLLSDTLFGHKRGAFTGADLERKGLIEQANGGTLFLDEIGDLGIESQVKLLRLLQEGNYYPIGADLPRTSDARIVLATNADLFALQKSGKFRKDLFYRIQAHQIKLPPLRERKPDLPLLIDHFMEKAASLLNKKPPTPPKELMTLLRNYPFPGNIRELEGLIFDAVSRHKSGILSMESIKEKLDPQFHHALDDELPQSNGETLVFPDALPTLKQLEQLLIEEALQRADGNQSIAAQLLGLTRRALNNRLSRARQQDESQG